jgi:hypothetical protein
MLNSLTTLLAAPVFVHWLQLTQATTNRPPASEGFCLSTATAGPFRESATSAIACGRQRKFRRVPLDDLRTEPRLQASPLRMLQASMKAYLEEFVDEMARSYRGALADLRVKLSATKAKSENDVIHNVDVTTVHIYQTGKHAERHPKGLFTDEMWATLGMGGKIKVGRKLTEAIGMVDRFCEGLEGIRSNYTRT